MTKKIIKIGIVGGTGYTGVELLRLLVQHPNASLAAITSRSSRSTGGQSRQNLSSPQTS